MHEPNPFAPPDAELKVEPPAGALKPLGGLAQWVKGTGCATIGFSAATLVMSLVGAEADPESALALVSALVTLLAIGPSIANMIVFYMWVYRAVKAANALREAPQPRGPGLTVASFFLPFVSLFWPYQSIKAMFQASDPEDPIDYPYAAERSSNLIPLWWAVAAIGIGTDQAYLRASMREAPADLLAEFDLFGSALDLIELPLSIWIVSTISARLIERARRLGVPLG